MTGANRADAAVPARRRRKAGATHMERAAVLELERFLPYRLSVLSNRVSAAIADRYAERFGIGVTQWRVIALLGQVARLSAGELAERTAMDKVAVSRAVAALLERDLLVRAIDAEDRRRSLLRLSRAGRKLHAQVAPLALEIERELLGAFTATERATLSALLDKLVEGERRLRA